MLPTSHFTKQCGLYSEFFSLDLLLGLSYKFTRDTYRFIYRDPFIFKARVSESDTETDNNIMTEKAILGFFVSDTEEED